MTSTFKLKKVQLQREGYDPTAVNDDPLFITDPEAGAYVPLTSDTLDRLGISPMKGVTHVR
jgi:fatty-acyl-CoA synthase